MDVIWEKPPEAALERARIGTGHYADWALALKEHPGEWARCDREFATPDSARNTAANIRRGHVKGMRKGEYEVVTHGKQLWARYLDPDESDEDNPDPVVPDAARLDYGRRVRAWAEKNDVKVAKQGRIPERVVIAYVAATGDEPPEARSLRSVP